MAHPYNEHREDKAGKARAKQLTKYNTGGAVSSDGGAKAAAPKTATGGDTKISGAKSAPRLDKFARGGAVTKKKDGTTINIAVVGGGKDKAEEAPPAPPMMAGPPPMPPGPPPGGPPGLPMSPGIGPGKPPMGGPPGFKKGGRIKMTAGAESGVGRLQKAGKKR